MNSNARFRMTGSLRTHDPPRRRPRRQEQQQRIPLAWTRNWRHGNCN